VTLYSEQGIKVFSINPKDEHYVYPLTYFKMESGNTNNSEEDTEIPENDVDEKSMNFQDE
jgi:hypothetical protein